MDLTNKSYFFSDKVRTQKVSEPDPNYIVSASISNYL